MQSDIQALCASVAGHASCCWLEKELLLFSPGEHFEFLELVHSQSPTRIALVEHRGITFAQLNALLKFVLKRCDENSVVLGWKDLANQPISYNAMNLYHVADHIIRPMTRQARCSYVEAIAANAANQRPEWFISHWWGEPVVAFVRCLSEHVYLRKLLPTMAYWICAYGNNQHELGAELVSDPRATSFYKAMLQCTGVLLILDEHGTPFKRSWCCFEESIVVTPIPDRKVQLLFDIGVAQPHVYVERDTLSSFETHDAEAAMICDGLTEMDMMREQKCRGSGWALKHRREAHFPMELLKFGALELDITKAMASQAVDHRRIMNSIAGSACVDETLPHAHPAFDRVNKQLRAVFAEVGCPRTLTEDPKLRSMFIAALRHLARRTFDLRLNNNGVNNRHVDDSILVEVASGLPPHLEQLTLSMANTHVSDKGIEVLSNCFPVRLTHFHMDVSGTSVTDAGLSYIANSFAETMLVLHIGAAFTTITGAALSYIANKLPTGLESLCLNLRGCDRICDKSIRELMQQLPATVTDLKLRILGTSCTGDSAWLVEEWHAWAQLSAQDSGSPSSALSAPPNIFPSEQTAQVEISESETYLAAQAAWQKRDFPCAHQHLAHFLAQPNTCKYTFFVTRNKINSLAAQLLDRSGMVQMSEEQFKERCVGTFAELNYIQDNQQIACALLALYWICKDQYERFVCSQDPEQRLTHASWQTLHAWVRGAVSNPDILSTLMVLLVIKCPFRDASFNKVFAPSHLRNDNEISLRFILRELPILLPSYSALDKNMQGLIASVLLLDINMGQFLQAEFPPAIVVRYQDYLAETENGMASLKFWMSSVVVLFAGVLGERSIEGSLFLTEKIWADIKPGIEILGCMPDQSAQEVYNRILESRACKVGFAFNAQDAVEYSKIRLACLSRIHQPAPMQDMLSAFDALERDQQFDLSQLLVADGIEQPALLPWGAPEFLYLTQKNSQLGLLRGLQMLLRVSKALAIADKGPKHRVTIVVFDELHQYAKECNDPAAFDSLPIELEKFSAGKFRVRTGTDQR